MKVFFFCQKKDKEKLLFPAVLKYKVIWQGVYQ